MKIRTKKCPNCKCQFVDRSKQIVYTSQLKCFSCAECQAVISRKRAVFAVDLAASPVLRNLLNVHHRIRTLANYQKWAEAFVRMYAENRDLPTSFGGLDMSVLADANVPLEDKLNVCATIDNLNREYRLRSFRIKPTNIDDEDGGGGGDEDGNGTPSNEMLEQMKALEASSVFALLKKYREPANPQVFVEQKLAADERYLVKLSSCLDGVKDLNGRLGHYSGTSGNAAKKASTRVWRALRFLELCNRLANKLYPSTLHVIDLNFNRNTNVSGLFEHVKLTTSKVTARRLFDAVQTAQANNENQVALDRFFYIRMVRKESRYNTPLCPSSRKQIFLQDFGEPSTYSLPSKSYKSCTLSQKAFDYIVIMNVQSREKMSKIFEKSNSALAKMGKDIWLSSVYALEVRKPVQSKKAAPRTLRKKKEGSRSKTR